MTIKPRFSFGWAGFFISAASASTRATCAGPAVGPVLREEIRN